MPFPANYGGVIDVFHRIRTLHRLGVDIRLHTFHYGRPQQPELEKYCSQVYYYPRKTGILSFLSSKPYIVKSRESSLLLQRLSQDSHPILLEGLHCCSLLESIDGNRIMVRAHNVEHDYYNRLASALDDKFSQEHNLFHLPSYLFNRTYLRTDARRLQRYESILLKARAVLAVTESDAAHFRAIGCRNVILMPSSHLYDEVVATPSANFTNCKPYALYHADLSVPENIHTVLYLADNIFGRLDCDFVVAGRNPANIIRNRLASFHNVRLVANPDDHAMRQLVADAHLHIMLTDSPTGLKLKLLNSLFAGRHVLVNSPMVAGTQLGNLCTVADDTSEQLSQLDRLMHTPFTQNDIDKRILLLDNLYSNTVNANILISLLRGSMAQ